VSQQRWTGRLMYTPHPETNRYPSLMPAHLADATERVHVIEYAHLVEMHEVIGELATLLAEINPRCVLFFATGGYPVVIPLLHRLFDDGEADLVSGSVFHMFPGLSWKGAIDGLRPDEYLARELEPVLRAICPRRGCDRRHRYDQQRQRGEPRGEGDRRLLRTSGRREP
jgi:hypothetical protein